MALKMEKQKNELGAQLLTEGPTTQADLQKLKKEASDIKDLIAKGGIKDSNKTQVMERIKTFVSDISDYASQQGQKVSDAIDIRDLADFCNRIQGYDGTPLQQPVFDAIETDMIKYANPSNNTERRRVLEELIVISQDEKATESYFGGLLNRLETGGYLFNNTLKMTEEKGYTYLYENTVAKICEKGYASLGAQEIAKMLKNGVGSGKIYDEIVRLYQNSQYNDENKAGLEKASESLVDLIEKTMAAYQKNRDKESGGILKQFSERIGSIVPNEIRPYTYKGTTLDGWINTKIAEVNLLIGNRTATEANVGISNLSVVKVNLPLNSFIREAVQPIILPTKAGYQNAEFNFLPPQEINEYTVGKNQSQQFSDAFAKGYFAQKTGNGFQPAFGEQVLGTLNMSSIPAELFNNPGNLTIGELRDNFSQKLKTGDLIGAYGMLKSTGELYGSISTLLNSAKITYKESYVVNDVGLTLGNKKAYDQIRRVYEGRDRDPEAKWIYISGVRLGTSILQQKTVDVTFDQQGNPVTTESHDNLKRFSGEMGILFNIKDVPVIISPGAKYSEGDKGVSPTIRVQQPVNGIIPIQVKDAYLELKKGGLWDVDVGTRRLGIGKNKPVGISSGLLMYGATDIQPKMQGYLTADVSVLKNLNVEATFSPAFLQNNTGYSQKENLLQLRASMKISNLDLNVNVGNVLGSQKPSGPLISVGARMEF
ncbi:MAG: hypothetical protein WC506_02885 [Candidatus Micrarchaeia archaeon]